MRICGVDTTDGQTPLAARAMTALTTLAKEHQCNYTPMPLRPSAGRASAPASARAAALPPHSHHVRRGWSGTEERGKDWRQRSILHAARPSALSGRRVLPSTAVPFFGRPLSKPFHSVTPQRPTSKTPP